MTQNPPNIEELYPEADNNIATDFFQLGKSQFGVLTADEAHQYMSLQGAIVKDLNSEVIYYCDSLSGKTIQSFERVNELRTTDNKTLQLIEKLPEDKEYCILSYGQKTGKFQVTKIIDNLPCAHRQWRHPGHCKFVHGYSRSFHFWFEAAELEPGTNFVYEFGSLKEVKKWLEYMFDHTCLINTDDPEVETFKELHQKEIVDLRILPNVGMEATAKFVYERVNSYILQVTNGRAWVSKVEVRENEKNSGIYIPYSQLDIVK